MKRIRFHWLIILALLLSGCKTRQSASRSQTRMTSSSQVSALNKSSKVDTTTTYTVTQSNGYIFIKETQIITEYDTTQPTNPVSKKTETEKNTFQGVQAGTRQQQSEGNRSESENTMSGTHDSELTTQDSKDSSSTPVVQTTVKWYVIGGIIMAVLTLAATILSRRKGKRNGASFPDTP